MKLACSSTAFDELIRSGELTQLEWIDLCAHELGADGVVFDVRHFPRTDTDYLAQVKKMAADTGLTVAALRHDGFFEADREHVEQALELALAIGAPLLAAPLSPETSASWTHVLERLGTATSAAKRLNVTLALRNAPHTYAASTHDMKRVSKEADSAWLRYGPDFSAFDAASEPQTLVAKAVLVWQPLDPADSKSIVQMLAGYNGFMALDVPEGNANAAQMKNALRTWRSAFFEADRI
jgi:sugar phosphate isomerase/epimerase